jgi:hypothetical protein
MSYKADASPAGDIPDIFPGSLEEIGGEHHLPFPDQEQVHGHASGERGGGGAAGPECLWHLYNS